MTQDYSQPVNLPDFAGLDVDFDIVDAHHHLFDLNAVYYPWLVDETVEQFRLGDNEALRRDYYPADFRADWGGLRVVKSVHVEAEADHDNPLAETGWLAEVMLDSTIPSVLVAHAWLDLPESNDILAAQAAYPAVRGIRSKPVTSRSRATRAEVAGKPRSLQDPTWRKGLGLLRDHNLSWDLRVPYWHLREAAEVCTLYPDLPIVVEHTGLAWDRDADGLAEWRAGMAALAEQDHVFLKISELGLPHAAWDYADNRKVVRQAIELFGFERCMFASNFPVAKLRIPYGDQVRAIAHMVADCSQDERAALFHDTATAFYRL